MPTNNDAVRCTQCREAIARESDCSCVLIQPPIAVAIAASTPRWLGFCSYQCLRNWLDNYLYVAADGREFELPERQLTARQG